jgi:hypothetical protein
MKLSLLAFAFAFAFAILSTTLALGQASPFITFRVSRTTFSICLPSVLRVCGISSE